MDAEPFRCRRTDGKKWRCRLPVLPDQKYCERHVHRGRLCSRKPVEVHKTFLKSKSNATTSISSLKSTPNLQSHAKTNFNKVSIKNQSLKIKKHGNDLGRGASSNDHKFGPSERCRRTDGKKWRCKKDALQGLKYCVQHMHRGVKKVENGQKSNPCLPFSVGASCQQIGDNVNQSNDSRSSSEATTISM